MCMYICTCIQSQVWVNDMYSHENIKRFAAQSLVMPISAIMRTCCGVLFQEACGGKCSDYQDIFFPRLIPPQVGRKQCTIFKHVFSHPSMCRRRLDGDATQCSWGTLLVTCWIQSSVMQLCTLNLCGLYFLPSAVFLFPLGVYFLQKLSITIWHGRP